MALQPAANVRDKGWLLSPNGARFRATVLEDPLEAWNSLDREPGYKSLVIDEAHLWLRKEKELLALMLKARHKGLGVWLAGIEFDHLGKPFPWWQSIRPESDFVHRLTAPCDCGARASYTFRHGLSDASIQVDHLGHYQSCCLACFAIFRTARELRKQIAGLT
jgi:thymidine kinase